MSQRRLMVYTDCRIDCGWQELSRGFAGLWTIDQRQNTFKIDRNKFRWLSNAHPSCDKEHSVWLRDETFTDVYVAVFAG